MKKAWQAEELPHWGEHPKKKRKYEGRVTKYAASSGAAKTSAKKEGRRRNAVGRGICKRLAIAPHADAMAASRVSPAHIKGVAQRSIYSEHVNVAKNLVA